MSVNSFLPLASHLEARGSLWLFSWWARGCRAELWLVDVSPRGVSGGQLNHLESALSLSHHGHEVQAQFGDQHKDKVLYLVPEVMAMSY